MPYRRKRLWRCWGIFDSLELGRLVVFDGRKCRNGGAMRKRRVDTVMVCGIPVVCICV